MTPAEYRITVFTEGGAAGVTMSSAHLAAATVDRLLVRSEVVTLTVERLPVAADLAPVLPHGWEWLESDVEGLGALAHGGRVVNYDVPLPFAAQLVARYVGVGV